MFADLHKMNRQEKKTGADLHKINRQEKKPTHFFTYETFQPPKKQMFLV